MSILSCKTVVWPRVAAPRPGLASSALVTMVQGAQKEVAVRAAPPPSPTCSSTRRQNTRRPLPPQESCGLYLHMELVQALLGSEPNPSTAQLQHAGRKLEAVGFQVGCRLVERYTKERPRFSDTLEIIKFICKDFWFEVYRKQIDKLQTNNRVRRPPAHRPSKGRGAHPDDGPRRHTGGLHAAGQQASAASALLRERSEIGEREADGRAARQIPRGAHPGGAAWVGRHRLRRG